MTTEWVTTGRIVKGRLTITHRPAFKAALKQFEDGEVVVKVSRLRAARSLRSNRWYWGQVLHLISEHTGYEPEDLHEYFKQRFIPKHVALADANGEVIDDRVVGGSTTRLTQPDFSRYCERIRMFAATELHVEIPDPELTA